MPPAANIPESPDDFGAEPAGPVGEADRAHAGRRRGRRTGAGGGRAGARAGRGRGRALAGAAATEDIALGEPDPPDADSEDVESYAARRKRLQARRKQARRSSRWTAVVLVLFAFNVALVGARNEVVRYLPQTASLFAAIGLPVNLRHLSFENVHITKELQDGVNILVVEGTIVSTADKPVTRAAPALCRARRRRPGNLQLDRAAGPQHPRARREARLPQPAGLAAGGRQDRHGALLHRARRGGGDDGEVSAARAS